MKHLVFGPGAMGYFAFLGALSALSDMHALNELESISGASAGSILGFLFLISKGDTKWMMNYSLTVPVKSIMKPNIKTLLRSYGLIGSKKFRHVLEDLTHVLTGRNDITFKELYDHSPIRLYVSACCVDLHTTHYFSVDTTPTMSVLDAVCMSISIPFLFQSMRHGPWHYIDGGALEELPCGPYINTDPRNVLAFGIYGEWVSKGVKDLRSYSIEILGAAMGLRHKYTMFPKINIELRSNDTFDFNASQDAKIRMFSKGYSIVKKYQDKIHDSSRSSSASALPENDSCSAVSSA
jgi:predicted acylesterase/phospholipase RssA